MKWDQKIRKKSDKNMSDKNIGQKIGHEIGLKIRQINPTENRKRKIVQINKSDKENRIKNRTIKSGKEVGQKIGQKIGQKNYCLVGIKNCNSVGIGH